MVSCVKIDTERETNRSDEHIVLIIDEQRTSLGAMRPLLEQEGFRVLSANHGPKGLMLARNKGPDLILLEVRPSGLDVCRCLRQFSR